MTTKEKIEVETGEEENARLLDFLYACPVGLVEMSYDGTISMMNPLAMQLLLRLHPTPSMNILPRWRGTGLSCEISSKAIRQLRVRSVKIGEFWCALVRRKSQAVRFSPAP